MNVLSGFRHVALALCAVGCLGFSGLALAQAASPIAITNAVFQEVEVKAADGTVSKQLVPATRVLPGDEVVYEITYSNSGSTPATNVAIDNPMPAELVFVEASVPPTAVSVDGGETYGLLKDLTVAGENGARRQARPADVTHLRWQLASLAPGAEGHVTFRARVK